MKQDKLLITTLGTLAQKRLARGLPLNRTETVALISHQLQEFIRDANHSVAELMDLGKKMLGRRHVLPGVGESIHDIQVEGTFKDGSFLVSCHDPICSDDGDLALALYGSFLPIPGNEKFDLPKARSSGELAGAVVCRKERVKLNVGRKRWSVEVRNAGDRPIQVSLPCPMVEFF